MSIEENIDTLNSNYIASKNLLKFSVKEENGVYLLFVDDTKLMDDTAEELNKTVVFREAILNRGRI